MSSAEQTVAPGTGRTEQIDAVVASTVDVVDGQRWRKSPRVESGSQTERCEQRSVVAGPQPENDVRTPERTARRAVDRWPSYIQEQSPRCPGGPADGQTGRRQDGRRDVDRWSNARWTCRQPTRRRLRVYGLPQEEHDQKMGGTPGVSGDGQTKQTS